MNERKVFKKIDGKDLINIGVFTAIYFVVVFAVAMLGMIPIFLVLLTVFVPLVGGIIFELFLTKVKKFGMITIMGFLLGLIMLLTGMGYIPIITGTFFGFLADITYTKGRFTSAKLAVLANGFFSIWCWGNYYELFFNPDAYWSTRQVYGEGYINAVRALFPTYMAPILVAVCFVSGIFGGLLGRVLLKKHFKRAGIA